MRGHEPNRPVETIYLGRYHLRRVASDQIGGRLEFGMPGRHHWNPQSCGFTIRPRRLASIGKPCHFMVLWFESVTDEILTVSEVAGLLKVAEKRVYTMAQQGELPAFKVRGEWRLRRTDLDAWIDAKTRGGAAEEESK
jgi:excisionase family DNA binding protein